MNSYEWKDGKLHHYINGELRAVIPAKAVADYKQLWTDAPDHE